MNLFLIERTFLQKKKSETYKETCEVSNFDFNKTLCTYRLHR